MKVIFDASALMTPSRDGIDVFEEAERLVGGYEPAVPGAVVRELENLAEEGNTDASVALGFIGRCTVLDTDESHGDDAIVEATEGEKERPAVATNDTKLKNRLLKRNVPVLYPRQRNRLEIENP